MFDKIVLTDKQVSNAVLMRIDTDEEGDTDANNYIAKLPASKRVVLAVPYIYMLAAKMKMRFTRTPASVDPSWSRFVPLEDAKLGITLSALDAVRLRNALDDPETVIGNEKIGVVIAAIEKDVKEKLEIFRIELEALRGKVAINRKSVETENLMTPSMLNLFEACSRQYDECERIVKSNLAEVE